LQTIGIKRGRNKIYVMPMTWKRRDNRTREIKKMLPSAKRAAAKAQAKATEIAAERIAKMEIPKSLRAGYKKFRDKGLGHAEAMQQLQLNMYKRVVNKMKLSPVKKIVVRRMLEDLNAIERSMHKPMSKKSALRVYKYVIAFLKTSLKQNLPAEEIEIIKSDIKYLETTRLKIKKTEKEKVEIPQQMAFDLRKILKAYIEQTVGTNNLQFLFRASSASNSTFRQLEQEAKAK